MAAREGPEREQGAAECAGGEPETRPVKAPTAGQAAAHCPSPATGTTPDASAQPSQPNTSAPARPPSAA